jgi:single-strand DNA-binding protein
MKNVAEFTIIGRVGAVKPGKVMRVTVASNYRMRDENGQWKEDAHWNEITVFNKARQGYIEEHITKGDLVHVRGRIRQNSYKRADGSMAYTVDLIAMEFDRLAQGSERVRQREAA